MSLALKNITELTLGAGNGFDVEVDDLGITVFVSEDYLVDDEEFWEIKSSGDILDGLTNGYLQMLDSTGTPYTLSESLTLFSNSQLSLPAPGSVEATDYLVTIGAGGEFSNTVAYIDPITGNIGINDLTPSADLTIKGDVKIEGPSTGSTEFRVISGSDIIYNLPTSQASPAQVLLNDGNGNLSWGDNGSGGVTGDMCTVQLRRTTDLYGSGTPQSISFDQIIIENDASILERDDINTSRVLINETGLYQVTYSVTHDIETGDFQHFKVRLNGTTDIDQSIHTVHQNGSVDSDYYPIHNTFAADLTDGDYIELFYEGNNTSHLENCRIHFYVLRLKGSKGDTGATGSGSNIVIQKDDVTVGTLTDTLNFEGSGISTAIDEGSNKTTITITNTDTCDFSNGGDSAGYVRSLGNNDPYALSLKTNNADRIVVASDGKVGIGNTPSEFFEVRRTAVGSANHVRFTLKDTLNTDDYNLNIDTNDKGSAIFSFEDGSKRQAVVFGADTNGGNKTVLGVGISADSGSTWDPSFVVTFDRKVGIGKHTPTEALDIIGNIILTGTVDGRDIALDGTNQDSHISNVSNPHSITKAQVALSDVENITVNLSTTVAPIATDDSGSGYAVGSRWIDVTANKEYVCVDSTASAAIWTETTSIGGGGSGDVTSSASVTDNRIVRGDGGAKGIQEST